MALRVHGGNYGGGTDLRSENYEGVCPPIPPVPPEGDDNTVLFETINTAIVYMTDEGEDWTDAHRLRRKIKTFIRDTDSPSKLQPESGAEGGYNVMYYNDYHTMSCTKSINYS